MKKYILPILLIFAGCVPPTSNIPFSTVDAPPDGQALVYIYRPHHHVCSQGWPIFHIGDSHSIELADSTFTSIALLPGKYVLKPEKRSSLEWGTWGPPAEFNFVSGRVYFIRFGIVGQYQATVIGGAYSSNAYQLPFLTQLVGQDEAVQALKELHYLPHSSRPKQ